MEGNGQHICVLFQVPREEHDGITDLTTSFFQVPLPPHLRPLFCFRTTDGQTLQMTAPPMGLNVSPEVMHTITSTLAGHPSFPTTPLSGVKINVRIDNIQVSGPRSHVEAALCTIKEAATTRFRVSPNGDGTAVPTKYTFAGVTFDHKNQQVALGPKAHAKLKAEAPTHLTLEKLERILGKLWFAARVLALPVRRYWWCLQATRRLFSQWSRGMRKGDAPLTLPRAAARELSRWCAAAAANAPRRIHRLPDPAAVCDLFTDATLTGSGAVVIDRNTKLVAIAGSKWEELADNINAAETRAVQCAFLAFPEFLPRGATVELHIDNTSALSALRKGFSRSHAINAELNDCLVSLPYRVHATYIRSAENPADFPSRDARYQTTTGTIRNWVRDSTKALG